jgi:sugar lactone lactonase YvrE
VRVTRQGDKFPYPCEIMNPTGLAFSPDGQLYISSRHDGTVLRYTDFDRLDVVAEDLGTPTGLVFDSKGNLFVGDRTGRIWKIDAEGLVAGGSPENATGSAVGNLVRKKEFAALEPSISAYHLVIDYADRIYVTGPTFAVRDRLCRISAGGEVETLLSGLARPQGMAFLPDGDLLIATGYKGMCGIFRYGVADGFFRPFVVAPTLVGLAVADGTVYLATGDALYGAPLPGHSVN